ncbi:hypothetical protein ACF3NA_01395 [Alkanindiges sp. WGS2144]|uniref:hypothetical protein n=1 Tax=Alkanindiges sp. WGS2144 TaxID=3366808 RepID=UPI003751D530
MLPKTTAQPDSLTLVAPAPWQLKGEGYVVVAWLPATGHPATKSSWLRPHGSIRLLIFAHYTHSDAGPYDELLHIPHLSHGAVQGYPSIDKIYVSTMDSVVNGQQNWGIPKQLAAFDYHKTKGQSACDQIQVKTPDQQPIARISIQPGRIRFPLNTAFVPARLRTLVQDWQGKRFYTAPQASGQAGLARVRDWWFDPAYFPDLGSATILTAIKINRFHMTFPVAKITQLD